MDYSKENAAVHTPKPAWEGRFETRVNEIRPFCDGMAAEKCRSFEMIGKEIRKERIRRGCKPRLSWLGRVRQGRDDSTGRSYCRRAVLAATRAKGLTAMSEVDRAAMGKEGPKAMDGRCLAVPCEAYLTAMSESCPPVLCKADLVVMSGTCLAVICEAGLAVGDERCLAARRESGLTSADDQTVRAARFVCRMAKGLRTGRPSVAEDNPRFASRRDKGFAWWTRGFAEFRARAAAIQEAPMCEFIQA